MFHKPFSGFSVNDADAAREFYTDVLQLDVREIGNDFLHLVLDGDTIVLVYPKEDHQPASFTVLNLPVDDVHAAVAELGERGVTFLRYDGAPQDEFGVASGEGPEIAWFTDPAGNVLSVIKHQEDDF
jgi:catechol 2,3-dioxygenase-like lactoylglutathione lyase family enzyme